MLADGREEAALGIAAAMCGHDPSFCSVAVVLARLLDRPGDAPDVALSREIGDGLAACRAGNGDACLRLGERMQGARPFLALRGCAAASEAACTEVRVRYGREGDGALVALTPEQRARVVPSCPARSAAACAAWYEERGDALGAASLDAARADAARAFALYRAACDSDGERVSACAKLARYAPRWLDPVGHVARACRRGSCGEVAGFFRHGVSLHERLGGKFGEHSAGECARAVYEQRCFEGAASACRSLADELAQTGYSMGHDPAYAARLTSHAEHLERRGGVVSAR
jgi:hypothetical protein